MNEGLKVRQLVFKDELISILNKELSKYEECENCIFTGIVVLDEKSQDGCNWLGAKLELICGSDPSEKCRPFVSKILSEAGVKYNIKN